MLQLTPQTRVFLACEPADFRRGIDGLAALCRQCLAADPMLCFQREYAAAGRKQLAKCLMGVEIS